MEINNHNINQKQNNTEKNKEITRKTNNDRTENQRIQGAGYLSRNGKNYKSTTWPQETIQKLGTEKLQNKSPRSARQRSRSDTPPILIP